jgi:hypothetical protein
VAVAVRPAVAELVAVEPVDIVILLAVKLQVLVVVLKQLPTLQLLRFIQLP